MNKEMTVLKRLKDNRFALVATESIYTLEGEELERGLIVDDYQSEHAKFIKGGDQLYHQLGEEALTKVYKTVGYTFEGTGVEIEEDTFYKIGNSKVVFSNNELLEILRKGNDYTIAKDDFDDYFVIKENTKYSCDEDILDVPPNQQYQLPNGDYIAFCLNDKLLGPCNELEILDRLSQL